MSDRTRKILRFFSRCTECKRRSADASDLLCTQCRQELRAVRVDILAQCAQGLRDYTHAWEPGPALIVRGPDGRRWRLTVDVDV